MSQENQHSDFNTFKKYYTGKMTPAEKSTFEKEMENDPFMQDAYNGFLVLENDFKRISAIENTNIAFKDKHALNDGGVVFPIKTLMGVAASVVLLIGGFFLVQKSFTNTNNNLAENKIEVVPETENQNNEITERDEADLIEALEDTNEMTGFTDGVLTENIEEEVSIEETVSADLEKTDDNLTNDNKTYTSESAIDKNKKSNNKQIGSDQYNEYYQNQKESQNVQNGYNNGTVTRTNSSISSETKDENAPSPSMFSNTVAIEEDMLESEEVSSVSNYKSGIVAYNQSNYTQAIQFFNSSINKKKNINSSNYYIGMSYFNQNKANKAINYFDKVIGTSSSFSDDSQWYKAISLINKGQKERARSVLIDIINSNSNFRTSAQNKLNSMN